MKVLYSRTCFYYYFGGSGAQPVVLNAYSSLLCSEIISGGALSYYFQEAIDNRSQRVQEVRCLLCMHHPIQSLATHMSPTSPGVIPQHRPAINHEHCWIWFNTPPQKNKQTSKTISLRIRLYCIWQNEALHDC